MFVGGVFFVVVCMFVCLDCASHDLCCVLRCFAVLCYLRCVLFVGFASVLFGGHVSLFVIFVFNGLCLLCVVCGLLVDNS